MSDGVVQERYQGTPQGGPLSPLLANVLLDEVDKELERRGHCFVRCADDANVYVRSRRAGERVRVLLRGLYGKLKLTIDEAKSAVAAIVTGGFDRATSILGVNRDVLERSARALPEKETLDEAAIRSLTADPRRE